jgi:hypothetical protein
MIPKIGYFYLIDYVPNPFEIRKTFGYSGKGRYTGDSILESGGEILYLFDSLSNEKGFDGEGYFSANDLIQEISNQSS